MSGTESQGRSGSSFCDDGVGNSGLTDFSAGRILRKSTTARLRPGRFDRSLDPHPLPARVVSHPSVFSRRDGLI